MKIGFDNELYVRKQMEHILERMNKFDNKLYIEFGGKLFDDLHAARVLPGFQADAKLKLLKNFADKAEIIICIHAADIEANKIRADLGITYDVDVLRMIDNLRQSGLTVTSVIITRYTGQPAARAFKRKLERRGMRAYLFHPVQGYPTELDMICSPQGFGSNPYVETTRPLVVVTAPGPNSGKLAACLSQLYHEHQRGVKAGYAKFETFPIWNLPLKHPVNLAYEAATADLKDVNMIDPFHLEAYGKTAVNYNRDIEVFPILRAILSRITGGDDLYKSPTDMGVNMAGYGIIDDEVVREAAKQEVIRRYCRICQDYKTGAADEGTLARINVIMQQMGLTTAMRRVVQPALDKAKASGHPAVAIELDDGRIITGRGSDMMSAAAGCMLNAIKALAGIDDAMRLLSPIVLEPISKMKRMMGAHDVSLSLEDVLMALSICAATNPIVETAFNCIPNLRGCDAHSSIILPHADESVLRKLGINITCEAEFPSKDLYFE
ncbi:MAG: DUF1846 domain-containing protein [Candidatus Fimadaptatus sp.]|nr:DUF1846 domain-containing protein [Candidatus Fimadaptatus sp.]